MISSDGNRSVDYERFDAKKHIRIVEKLTFRLRFKNAGRFSQIKKKSEQGNFMDVNFILKIAGIGMIVTVVCQLMSKAGRDEQSTMVSLAGMVLVLILIADSLGDLVSKLREVFGL